MYKSDRHAALEARYPSKPKHIAPAPTRQRLTMLQRFLKWWRA